MASSNRLVAAFSVDWIPPEGLRGNFRGHWGKQAGLAQDMRETGIALGLEFKQLTGSLPGFWPVTGPLAVDIWVTHSGIDGDNLLYGYKRFIDGLQVTLSDGSRGAGIIQNDRQIVDWRILCRTDRRRTHSAIYLRRVSAVWEEWAGAVNNGETV